MPKEVDPFNRPGFVQIRWLAEAIAALQELGGDR